MKKNCKAKVFCRLSVMRGALCGLLLLSLTTLFTHSPVYGQQNVKRISLKLEATSLLEALREINRLGDNVVVFKKEEVAGFYMDFLKERGLRVPEDISLVSFDDAGPEQEAELKILSVIHPKYNLGRITARNLLRMMEDPDWQKKNYAHQFPVAFNNGNSVRDIR